MSVSGKNVRPKEAELGTGSGEAQVSIRPEVAKAPRLSDLEASSVLRFREEYRAYKAEREANGLKPVGMIALLGSIALRTLKMTNPEALKGDEALEQALQAEVVFSSPEEADVALKAVVMEESGASLQVRMARFNQAFAEAVDRFQGGALLPVSRVMLAYARGIRPRTTAQRLEWHLQISVNDENKPTIVLAELIKLASVMGWYLLVNC